MNTRVSHCLAQCCPPVWPPSVLAILVSRPPKERDRRHFKGGEGKPSPQGRRKESATLRKHHQERHKHATRPATHNHTTPTTIHNNTQQHNTTTTQPHTCASQCAPYRITILVSRLVSWFSSVVFRFLSLFLSCPSCLFSVLTRFFLCVLMYVCSSVSLSVRLCVCHRDNERFVVWEHKCLLLLKMVNYAWERQSQKHFVDAPLTCQLYVILACRDERLVEPSSSCFLPQFLSHQAVNRERVVLDLFSDMFYGVSFFKFFSRFFDKISKKQAHSWQLMTSHRKLSQVIITNEISRMITCQKLSQVMIS